MLAHKESLIISSVSLVINVVISSNNLKPVFQIFSGFLISFSLAGTPSISTGLLLGT